MIRKIKEYKQALELRKHGKSIRYIAKKLNISPATASVWCNKIILSPEQKTRLLKSSARIQHLRRLAKQSALNKILRVKKITKEAREEIKPISSRELFLVGLALYWAEGFKSLKEGRLGFCNSDPRMIKLIMKWFRKSLGIKAEDFIFRTEFNESHKDRELEIKNYWSKLAGIPVDKFEKSFYHKSTWLKEYKNRDDYYGILRIRIRKSSIILNKTRGWITGLSNMGH